MSRRTIPLKTESIDRSFFLWVLFALIAASLGSVGVALLLVLPSNGA